MKHHQRVSRAAAPATALAAAATKRREEALLDFVRGGKGVIGFHGTTDSRSAMLYELFHGRFNGHPWLGNEKTTVRVDDPKHALTRSFAGEPFEIVDEIYQFTDKQHADFRKHGRVLLALDMTKTPPKGSRADQDYAVAWVKKVVEGRLFYSSLGTTRASSTTRRSCGAARTASSSRSATWMPTRGRARRRGSSPRPRRRRNPYSGPETGNRARKRHHET